MKIYYRPKIDFQISKIDSRRHKCTPKDPYRVPVAKNQPAEAKTGLSETLNQPYKAKNYTPTQGRKIITQMNKNDTQRFEIDSQRPKLTPRGPKTISKIPTLTP